MGEWIGKLEFKNKNNFIFLTAAREHFIDCQLWRQKTNEYFDAQQARFAEKIAATAAEQWPTKKRQKQWEGSDFSRGTHENFVKNPLYGGGVAITFWNATEANGFRQSVRQYHPLTKLNEECWDAQYR